MMTDIEKIAHLDKLLADIDDDLMEAFIKNSKANNVRFLRDTIFDIRQDMRVCMLGISCRMLLK